MEARHLADKQPPLGRSKEKGQGGPRTRKGKGSSQHLREEAEDTKEVISCWSGLVKDGLTLWWLTGNALGCRWVRGVDLGESTVFH